MTRRLALLLLLATAFPSEAALLRFPAVSAKNVAFVYDGQLWIAPRTGGAARRLTDTPGRKFDPRFSPDGSRIAFSEVTGRGSVNIFTMAATGGAAAQITWLPSHQVLCQWTNDDQLLFYTNALSFSGLEMQVYLVSALGGLPRKLPPPAASEASIDASGRWLAHTTTWPNGLNSAWQAYRGGMAPDLRLVDLRSGQSTKITDWIGSDSRPMWHGDTLYYLSDAGPERRMNVWSYRGGVRRQVTQLDQFDIRYSSIGGDAIVFQYGAELRLLDLRTDKLSTLHIDVPPPAAKREVDAGGFITARHLSPGGASVLFEARGDLWIARPNGAPRNLTATSGAFEREARWSPDGKSIAYVSDATGEYQLYVRDVEGRSVRRLTNFENGFRYRPVWSPDSRRLVFSDHTSSMFTCDVESGRVQQFDRDPWAQQPEFAFAPDSSWIAYTRTSPNRLTALWRYDIATGERRRISSDAYNVATPVFTPKGDRLLVITWRNFSNAVYDFLTQRVAFRALTQVLSLPASGTDWRDYERRGTRLATATGAITGLAATGGGDAVYALTDGAGNRSVRIVEDGKDRALATDTNDFDLAGDRLLLVRGDRYTLRDVATADETALTTKLPVTIERAEEFRQIFDEAAREYRDFFHAPAARKVDWMAMRRHYQPMLEAAATRDDLNFVLSQFIGESSVGHAYVLGEGDAGAPPPPRNGGMLGADFVAEAGAIRVARIHEGAPSDEGARSPLRDAGVEEGERLVAINGIPVDASRDPLAALDGLAGKKVTLTVGTREVTVTPVANEFDLRYRAWVEQNRAYVEQASGGRVGYIHLPDFSTNGIRELVRQLTGQIDRRALIIDARWSTGGYAGAIDAELLARPSLNFAAERYSDRAWPALRWGAHAGPKCLLVNGMVVSAGENFAYYFRRMHIGPILGTRTWGGLTGLNGVPALIDGGSVNVPNAPFFDESGWLIEGHGLEPDVVVDDEQLLETAVKSMLQALPVVTPR
jgi:tricorn protease